eukprot:CAMPEP_0194144478 /NCGR_PEP_ID=MMETSP0152-20130528/13533_1 /TAXON_ID=1049557 /ORGANISM="Thalassiothrix antarctica, Strain L6-D1" /LENGTH=376 /DNA_ID=CAMNT_0038844355 /DNA_START=345 /DNA_END=1472 /DNA_ORIENTATION=+
MLPNRKELVRLSLPSIVKLEFWEDAIPLGYDTSKFTEGGDTISRVNERKISLARQHRFVIKDKLQDSYDLFVNFEDDMLIKGHHIQHYLYVTQKLEQLKRISMEDVTETTNYNQRRKERYYKSMYYGNLTRGQLNRIIPGFIRAEVLLNDKNNNGRETQFSIPIDNNNDGATAQLDPIPCCHISKEHANNEGHLPSEPNASQIIIWETSILALGVRHIPQLGWVTMLRGPKTTGEANTMLTDYWSGNDGYYKKEQKRPTADNRAYINNQGGWMGTKEQIYAWHTEICPGSFLPPFDVPHFRFDGLDLRDVEWWSGGLHLFTLRHACNMQRVVLLDKNYFGRHLLYHTTNNKQKKKLYSKATDLLGQLRTVVYNAQK